MICTCGSELVWGGDNDLEDFGMEGEGIVSNLSCLNDDCEVTDVLVTRPFKK